jgi:bacterioferritin (cytochrome b1)
MTKGDIEKITLNLQNDTISKNLLHEILNKEEEQKKIVKLMFDGCKI